MVRQDLETCRQILCQIKSMLRMFSVGNAIISTIALLNQVQRISCRQARSAVSPTASSSFRAVYSYISGSESIDQCFDAILRYIQMHFSNQSYTTETSDTLFVNTVLEFVQNSYFDINLSSQLIADYLGLNNRYLMKKFKSLTGGTLNEYIVDLRMKKAAVLLRGTQAPVSSIAEQVGIDNLSYFYRLFKKVYGCTPGEFREAENP